MAKEEEVQEFVVEHGECGVVEGYPGVERHAHVAERQFGHVEGYSVGFLA